MSDICARADRPKQCGSLRALELGLRRLPRLRVRHPPLPCSRPAVGTPLAASLAGPPIRVFVVASAPTPQRHVFQRRPAVYVDCGPGHAQVDAVLQRHGYQGPLHGEHANVSGRPRVGGASPTDPAHQRIACPGAGQAEVWYPVPGQALAVTLLSTWLGSALLPHVRHAPGESRAEAEGSSPGIVRGIVRPAPSWVAPRNPGSRGSGEEEPAWLYTAYCRAAPANSLEEEPFT